MFHKHKWTKWEIIEMVKNYSNGLSIDMDMQKRECTKCGLQKLKRLN